MAQHVRGLISMQSFSVSNPDLICINSLNPSHGFNLFKTIFRPLGASIMNFIKQEDYIMYSFMIN